MIQCTIFIFEAQRRANALAASSAVQCPVRKAMRGIGHACKLQSIPVPRIYILLTNHSRTIQYTYIHIRGTAACNSTSSAVQ